MGEECIFLSCQDDTDHERVEDEQSTTMRYDRRQQQQQHHHARSDDEEEDDPFHLKSHPTAKDDGICVRAYEASWTFDQRSFGPRPVAWHGNVAQQDLTIAIETDEYDILHLLDCLPSGGTLTKGEHTHEAMPASPTPSGMSDLPSDVEDMFFMQDEEEIDAFQRAKKQRRLDDLRTARVAALEQREEEEEEEEKKGGDGGVQRKDSEVLITQAQLELMQKTARAIRTAGNPSVLEMRILTNHAHDPRFAFLRASTKDSSSNVAKAWNALRRGNNVTLDEANGKKVEQEEAKCGVHGLIAYESSDEDEEERQVVAEEQPGEVKVTAEKERREEKKKRKLALAREWSRQRQARLQNEREREAETA